MPAPLRRNFYVDSRYGQLHVQSAAPASTETARPPLYCFHQGPQSGKVFAALFDHLATDRAVYAPDYPGCGGSTGADEPFDLQTLAALMLGLIRSQGDEQIDILGYHTGSCIAAELAIEHPDLVRRLVLVGAPILDADFDVENLYRTGDGQPIPAPLAWDGSHWKTEWDRSAKWFEGASIEVVQRAVIDKAIAGEHQTWASRAALTYPLRERLPLVKQPILAIGPKDDLFAYSPRAEPLIENGGFERWPEHGFGLFDIAPERVNAAVRAHLDG